MGQRKCAKDGCNRLEFRVSGFCLKHKDSIVPRSKPESILIKSSDITDHQSKKPGRSSNPTVEKKERASDARSTKSDSKGKKTDIVVNDSKEDNRAQTGLMALFLILFGFFGLISSSHDFDGDVHCCFSIIIVIDLYLITQSFSPTAEKKVGFLALLSSVLLKIFFVCVIGFFILLWLFTEN